MKKAEILEVLQDFRIKKTEGPIETPLIERIIDRIGGYNPIVITKKVDGEDVKKEMDMKYGTIKDLISAGVLDLTLEIKNVCDSFAIDLYKEIDKQSK